MNSCALRCAPGGGLRLAASVEAVPLLLLAPAGIFTIWAATRLLSRVLALGRREAAGLVGRALGEAAAPLSVGLIWHGFGPHVTTWPGLIAAAVCSGSGALLALGLVSPGPGRRSLQPQADSAARRSHEREVAMSLVDHIRSSPPYGIWRALRERQQLARFEELFRDGGSAVPYGETDAQAALRQRAGGRRPLPTRPHVVAFGVQDWEQHGLWPAWSRLGPFAVFDYGRRACATSGPSREVRKALGQEFLAFLGQRERDHGPVQLVFLYAAGFWIDPELLQELSRRGVWTLLMALDDKHQQPGPRRNDLAGWQLEVARTVDLYWTTWRGGVDWLAAEGVTPLYAPEAAEPDLFKPHPVPKDIDVLWVGRAYGQRVRLVQWLRQNGFSVTALGPGWPSGPLTIEAMIQSYSRAKVVLGMGGVGHTDRIKHLKGRDFEVPMSQHKNGVVMRIFECCPFFCENVVAQLKADEAQGSVDELHVLECNRTFQNEPKEFVFSVNSPIVRYHRLDGEQHFRGPWWGLKRQPPYFGKKRPAWRNEAVQRNAVVAKIRHQVSDDDIVILSDIDEIIDWRNRDELVCLVRKHGIITVRLHFTLFFLNLYSVKWAGPPDYSYRVFLIRGDVFKRMPDTSDRLRKKGQAGSLCGRVHCPERHMGFHHSWLGDAEFVARKLRAYSHSEWEHSAAILDGGSYSLALIGKALQERQSIFPGHELVVRHDIEYLGAVRRRFNELRSLVVPPAEKQVAS